MSMLRMWRVCSTGAASMSSNQYPTWPRRVLNSVHLAPSRVDALGRRISLHVHPVQWAQPQRRDPGPDLLDISHYNHTDPIGSDVLASDSLHILGGDAHDVGDVGPVVLQ